MSNTDATARILVVDDDARNLLALQVALEPLGQEVITAGSAGEALRYAADDNLAVILLDVRMPGVDGFEAASQIRQIKGNQHPPIIFITSHTSDEVVLLKGYGEGAADFLHKPIVPEILRSKVQTFLNLHLRNHEVKQREMEIRLLNEDLENRVQERTSELELRTAELRQEVEDRKRAESHALRQMQLLAALRTIDLAITGSIDLRVTLAVILDQVTANLMVDAAAILLMDRNDGHLRYCASRGFRGPLRRVASIRVGEGFPGKVALSREPLYKPDVRTETGQPLTHGEEAFIGYCAVPLITKGHVNGVLEIYHRSVLEPQQDWTNFLEALAGQAAIAIENASLFDDLSKSHMELALAYDRTIEGWSRALDLRDKETEGHSMRVTDETVRLAEVVGIRSDELVHIRRGALLHDIGKMGVPDSILLKPGPLDQEEWEIMRKHPSYAYELLSPVEFLHHALDIPYCHHEKWDGTGYPRGLKGRQIPLSARVFAVVDVWDALRSDRPYRKGWPDNNIIDYLRQQKGSHFEPEIVDAYLALREQGE